MNGETAVSENTVPQEAAVSRVTESSGEHSLATPSEPETVASAAESAAVETPAAPAAETAAEPPRRRVQLNPTVSPEQARPVASYGTSSAPAPIAEPPSTSESPTVDPELATLTPPPPLVPAVPVELPPANASLDQSLEAEINAAMAGAMQAPAATAPAESGPSSTLTPLPATEDQWEPGTKLKA
jgi:hypothetical protein